MRQDQYDKAKALEPKTGAIKNRLKDVEDMVQFMADRKGPHRLGDGIQTVLIPNDLFTAFLFATKAYWEQKLKELEAEMAAI